MKLKYLLTACLCLTLISLAWAESTKDLFDKGNNAYQKGDYTQAAKFMKKICNRGDTSGCYNLGVLYRDGKGVKQSYIQAAKLFEKACNNGDLESCSSLGVAYGKGHGVKQSDTQAIKLWEKACNGNIAKGCYNLAILYDDAQNIDQNYDIIAQKYYKKACELEHQNACNKYKKTNQKDIQ